MIVISVVESGGSGDDNAWYQNGGKGCKITKKLITYISVQFLANLMTTYICKTNLNSLTPKLIDSLESSDYWLE